MRFEEKDLMLVVGVGTGNNDLRLEINPTEDAVDIYTDRLVEFCISEKW